MPFLKESPLERSAVGRSLFGRDEISSCSTQDEGLANTVGIGNEMRGGGGEMPSRCEIGQQRRKEREESYPHSRRSPLKGRN